MIKIAMFSDKNKCNENDPQGKPSEDILPHQHSGASVARAVYVIRHVALATSPASV